MSIVRQRVRVLTKQSNLMKQSSFSASFSVVVFVAVVSVILFSGQQRRPAATPQQRQPTNTTQQQITPPRPHTATQSASPAQSTPVQPAPAQSAPAQSAPVQAVPAQSAPAQSAPVRSAPVRHAPAQSAPAQSIPVQSATSMPHFFLLPTDIQFEGTSRTARLLGDPRTEGLYVTRTLIPKGTRGIPHTHPDSRTVVVL